MRNEGRICENMSIFRVEKNANYTVISNYHLRDKNLSLKTIGLLSVILSLPDNWDYSQAGLAAICKDGEDSIRSGLKELEKHGYLVRERERDENGRMRGIVYHIYEVPLGERHSYQSKIYEQAKPSSTTNCPTQKYDLPKQENPILVNPISVNPTTESPAFDSPAYTVPTQVKHAQIIKDVRSTDVLNTETQNKELQINPSIYRTHDSIHDRQMGEIGAPSHYVKLKQIVRENVGYDFFQFKCQQIDDRLAQGKITLDEYDVLACTYDSKKLDQVIDYMLDILASMNNDPIKIGEELIDRELVKSKLLKIQTQNIQRVIHELNTNFTIKNPKKYAISMLYNS
jgi:hypothetical protein